VVALDQIIKECKQYNKFAQKLLYDKYAPTMTGICFRYISDPDTVKDIIQDGFIKVFSKIKQYSGNGSFEGWMKRIFVNTAISHIRKQKNYKKHLSIEDIEETILVDESAGHNNENVIDKKNLDKNEIDFQLVESADFSENELLQVLDKVPTKYRIVFNLSCIEGFKHEEIAEMLDIDISTSRTRLMRARNLIQKELYEMSIQKLSS
jgi:RNA polymerase sigma-70 factor (ECF subfamily)